MKPLVSVLTPSFNQGKWLGDNLRSVATQTYDRIEHVVMDGGSSDDTLELLEKAGDSVVWASEPDRGQSHALNKAFAMSQGEIIGWINSDDAFADRRAIATAVDVFEKNPAVGAVYGHGLIVDAHNRVLQIVWCPSYSSELLTQQTYFIQPSVLIRRSCLDEFLVDEQLDFVMDRDLWIRLRDRTEFRAVDMFVGLDRNHETRKSLQSGMVEEMTEYDANIGVDHAARREALRRKGVKIALRWRGIPDAMNLRNRIDEAIPLEYPSWGQRLANQAVRPRARMR